MTTINVLGLVTLAAIVVVVVLLVRDLRAFRRMRDDLPALEAFRRRSIYRPLAVAGVVAITVGLLWLLLNVVELLNRIVTR